MSHSRGGMVDALSPSTVISQSIQNGSVCLNGRSCTASLNLLPGTIALVVCLVGVIALNILGYHYLSLCFVAGGIASGYTIYQGYKMRLLKTLEKSNHELKEHIEELWKNISGLREENNKLGGVLSEFERVNSELEKLIGVKKEENSMLCGENRSLKSLVVEQKELILRLEEDIRELNEIRLTLEQNMESHTESLTLLVSSLSGIQESASKDHKSFSTNLERLEGLLSKLPCLSENASERVVSFERLRNSQFLGLQKAIAALQEIFSIINEWKDTEAVSMECSPFKQDHLSCS